MMRVGLKALFSHQADMTIVGEATDGLTTEDIAKQLDISVSCVLKHFTTIFRKLDVTNRSEAIAVALRRQLLKV